MCKLKSGFLTFRNVFPELGKIKTHLCKIYESKTLNLSYNLYDLYDINYLSIKVIKIMLGQQG